MELTPLLRIQKGIGNRRKSSPAQMNRLEFYSPPRCRKSRLDSEKKKKKKKNVKGKNVP